MSIDWVSPNFLEGKVRHLERLPGDPVIRGQGAFPSYPFSVKNLENASHLILEAPFSGRWSPPKVRRGRLLPW